MGWANQPDPYHRCEGKPTISRSDPTQHVFGEGNRNREKGETVKGTKYPPRHWGTRQVFVPIRGAGRYVPAHSRVGELATDSSPGTDLFGSERQGTVPLTQISAEHS